MRRSERNFELKDFLEDVFLNVEECVLMRETDEIVRSMRHNELKPLNEVKDFTPQKGR
ncbi:MAG: hypothetical protein QXV46_00845 [Candidatus Bathyarchaeia archaeon]